MPFPDPGPERDNLVQFKGDCDGPVFGSCGREITKTLPEEHAPDGGFMRYRCPDCGTVALLRKRQI